MTIFYVFQSKTFEKEFAGEYVWSPQLTRNGQKNPGFTKMTEIQKGDYILHHNKGNIVALSIAKNNFYESDQPQELTVGDTSDLWNKEGFRVDTTYYMLDPAFEISSIRAWLIKNYVPESAFTVKGTGKQRYMCNLSEVHAHYILNQIINLQTNPDVLQRLEEAKKSI